MGGLTPTRWPQTVELQQASNQREARRGWVLGSSSELSFALLVRVLGLSVRHGSCGGWPASYGARRGCLNGRIPQSEEGGREVVPESENQAGVLGIGTYAARRSRTVEGLDEKGGWVCDVLCWGVGPARLAHSVGSKSTKSVPRQIWRTGKARNEKTGWW